MGNTADVVIIGGGVAGVNALYYLVERGVRNVLLLEMNTIGSGTTAYSSAYVTLQEPQELATRMSLISFSEFLAFENRFGFSLGDLTRGSFSVDIAENSETMIARAAIQESLGVPTETVTHADIVRIAPFLNTEDLGVGLLCRHGGAVDAHAFMQAYAKQAISMGASVCEDTKAVDIVTEGGKVVGVKTTAGVVSTPVVVNAAGVYAKVVGGWVGIDIPIANSLRHTILTEPSPLIPKDMPMLEILNPLEIYLEAKGDRADFSLGVDETDGFDHVAKLELLVDKYGDAIAYRMPEIANLGIVHILAGIRSMTPDGMPILGPVHSVDGYYNDCGWGGSGVSLSPFGGRLLADCITGTMTLPLTIEPFLLERFGRQ